VQSAECRVNVLPPLCILHSAFCTHWYNAPMRAVRLTTFGQPLAATDIADPRCGPDDVVIAVRAAGICHSDAHYRGGRGVVPRLPRTLGHEIAGVVVARGANVAAPAIGDRVAVHYLVSCGACDGCAFGEQFCVRGEMIGKDRDGGHAERVVVPARNAIAIADNVPDEQAAVMMCSTATAFHALRLANLERGESVAILGFGGLGISALQLAFALGASRVVAVDNVPEKLAAARAMGAETGELANIDVAIDLAGVPSLCTAALRALNPGGRLMLVALNPRPIDFDPYRDVLARERRIIGCSDHTRTELVELMELARTGKIDLSRAITRTVPLEAGAINGVLDDLERGSGHLRTVIGTS
jgi:2-desacetyl-2-hydroxyethyl bacteriochlorophyllide A dehydrogenase